MVRSSQSDHAGPLRKVHLKVRSDLMIREAGQQRTNHAFVHRAGEAVWPGPVARKWAQGKINALFFAGNCTENQG